MVNINKSKNKFMMRAIKLSIKNVKTGGGPFGTVIVKNNKIIAEGYNKVTKLNDPTAHGEIVAIRNACKSLKTFNLEVKGASQAQLITLKAELETISKSWRRFGTDIKVSSAKLQAPSYKRKHPNWTKW